MNLNAVSLFGSSPTQSMSAIASASSSLHPTATVHAPLTEDQSKPKLKRNRITLSCQPCHKRKQQCDRGQPCSRCVKRGTQEECNYDQPNKRRSSRESDGAGSNASDRVSQLESLVQSTLGGLEPSALAGLDALLQLVQASNAINFPAAHLTGPGLADSTRVTDHAVQVAAAALGQLSQQGTSVPSSSAVPVYSPLSEILGHIRGPGNPHAPSIPATLADLRNHFPNHAITNYLLTHFFEGSSIQWLWAVVHRPAFDSCYISFSSGPHPPNIDFIALLAIVCASALQFLPESDQDVQIFAQYESGRHVLRKRLYNFAHSVLVNGEIASYPSIERIQALLLLAIYLENEGDSMESYNVTGHAVRMAQTLALNRDGQTTWQMKPYEAEIRRRLWWTLLILDRFQCFYLRRPYIIHEHHCDVAIPLNLDQLELRDIADLSGKTLEQPTDYTFQILQIHWAQIIGRLWDRCFSIEIPSYRKIIDLEDEVRRYELDLPTSFRSQTVQGALVRPYLIFQNHYLTLQIYHLRIILLRTFLFIKGDKETHTEEEEKLVVFHRHAKAVCLTFCKRLLALHQLVQSQVHRAQLRWSSLVLWTFDAALALAFAIVVDPHDDQNEELDEWIALAESLLQNLRPYNVIVSSVVEFVAVLRKRTWIVLHPELAATENTSDPSSTDYGGLSVAFSYPVGSSMQFVERATTILARPQPSLLDLLGQKEVDDPSWTTTPAAVYAGNFPNFDTLCSPTNPQTLDGFLDTCISK